MMCESVLECEWIALAGGDGEAAKAAATLLIGHSNGPAVGRVGVAVTRIIQIENFFCEVEPSLRIKILRIVFSDHDLELTLPVRDHVMIRLDGGGEVVGIIIALLMEVH